MTDPFKYPATTIVNLHSNFLPNPRLPGVSAPIPRNFAPTDNPSTFDQAQVHNNTNPNRILRTQHAKPPKPTNERKPRPSLASSSENSLDQGVVKRGRPKKTQAAKGNQFPTPSSS